MRLIKWSICLAAALQASVSWSQGAAAARHETRPAEQAKATPASAVPALASAAGYRSPFADYRALVPDEPLEDWRRANDEVREAGGHVGLMKAGGAAQSAGHGAHGTQRPAPPGSKQ